MNIVALIQARMGSTRMPCKAMLCLHGMPLINWVVHRTEKSTLLNRVIVATPEHSFDDSLVFHLENQGIEVFRGPENDVLKRFTLAAEKAKATHIVRVCADNPLIWGGEIDLLIRHYLALPNRENAYAYNHIPRGNLYPDGLGAEIVSFALLQQLDTSATLPAHREHCLSYIWDTANQFCISTFDPPDPRLHHPEIKLDVDTPADYRRLALMSVHPDMPPAEVLLRHPRASS